MMYAAASTMTTDIFLHRRNIIPQSRANVFNNREFVLKQTDAKSDMLNIFFQVSVLCLNLLSLVRADTLFFRLLPEALAEVIRLWEK
jgi:hypothetical protein